MKTILATLAGLIVTCTTPANAAPTAPAPSTSASAPESRYTFSWPLNGSNSTPRGGSTRGPAVTLETAESPAWRSLHEPGLSALERDRRAILAIAGDYRATFDFLEVATYTPGATRDRPYQSWGTERVYVDQDRGTFISLVHILEMRTIKDDGSVSEPMVQKHWREDWQYEPKQLIEYQGAEQWQRRGLSGSQRRGQWSQTVDQTDDSPRYASLGRWEHSADLSNWISADTWRPLPRRESKRKDYQILLGTNRVTLTASGWLQEENNLKTALTADRKPDPAHPYMAREYGVARYERLHDADFAAATRYFERTQGFWDQVHQAWLDLFHHNAQVTLREPSDPDGGPYAKLFEYADQIAAGKAPQVRESELIRDALRDVGAPVQAAVAKAPAATSAVASASPPRGEVR